MIFKHTYLLFDLLSGPEGRKKVPSARKWKNRPCEEFDSWLKRGTFAEGDSVEFSIDLEKERRDIHDEKLRRREEIEWKEKVMDRILGVRQQQRESITTSAGQDIGFDPGIEMDDFGHSKDGLGDRTDAEQVEEELETSQESLVTHIRYLVQYKLLNIYCIVSLGHLPMCSCLKEVKLI